MECSKCGGLVVVTPDEARCINCGKYAFPPDSPMEFCSQGGTCGSAAERDGLCDLHWRQRMEKVNRGKKAGHRCRS